MNIEKLSQQLNQMNQHPPVEQWDPPFCGDMDIEIKTDGQWWYMGSPINRMPLVKLFASVLTRRNNEYLLVTPIEKVRIKVQDSPFLVTQWRRQNSEQGQLIIFTTNIGDEFMLSEQYSIQPHSNEQNVLHLNIHRGLHANLHRNVYYQLASIAEQETIDGTEHWVIRSGGISFSLGKA